MIVLKNEEIKIFESSQRIRRNREGNSINILNFKQRLYDGRSCRWMICDQKYLRGERLYW